MQNIGANFEDPDIVQTRWSAVLYMCNFDDGTRLFEHAERWLQTQIDCGTTA